MELNGMFVFHVVARLAFRGLSLCEFDLASWIWERLRVAFPFVFGACLMPDHVHVVAMLEDPAEGRRRMNRLFGRLACRLGLRYVGEAAEPKRITDPSKLLRDNRYVALNPPRAGLVDDPLAWLFSTHRDVVGATVDPWVDVDRLARALGRPVRGFPAWYHGYVSSDPSVRVAGTPLPVAAPPSEMAIYPLATIARAAVAAVRARPEAIRDIGVARDLFVGLAIEQGWTDASQLANACGCTPRGIRKIAARIDRASLAPARLCLGDPRLRRGIPLWRPTSRDAAAQVPARVASGPGSR